MPSHIKLKEHSFYQPISLAAAHAIAGQRAGILATLADEVYQQGLARLAANELGTLASTKGYITTFMRTSDRLKSESHPSDSLAAFGMALSIAGVLQSGDRPC